MLYQKNKYIEDFCEKYEDLDLKGLNNNDVRIGISLALFIFAAHRKNPLLMRQRRNFRRQAKS